MSVFTKQEFTSHSGLSLTWKIQLDDLTDEDWQCLAYIGHKLIGEFSEVIGIPTGGLKLAKHLQPYCTIGPRLIVDDVLTTGNSMEQYKDSCYKGLVVFARGECPNWVKPIFMVHKELSGIYYPVYIQ